jgi:hypothetical protein
MGTLSSKYQTGIAHCFRSQNSVGSASPAYWIYDSKRLISNHL